jgi:hypothetical protein
MNDFSVLKKLAQDANEQFPALEDQWSMVCTPTVGLELLAEIERLRTAEGDAMTYKAGMENVAQQRDQFKAEAKQNEMHMRAFGEVMKSQAAQIEQLKAEVERLEGDCDSHLEAHGKLGVHYFELKVDSEALRKALTDIRENSSDLGACECAADALADSRKKAAQ